MYLNILLIQYIQIQYICCFEKFKFCLIKDYLNIAFFVGCIFFLKLFEKYYPKLRWHNLDITGHTSKKTSLSKNGFALCMSPTFLAILFSRYFMRSFCDKFSSNKALRNLI